MWCLKCEGQGLTNQELEESAEWIHETIRINDGKLISGCKELVSSGNPCHPYNRYKSNELNLLSTNYLDVVPNEPLRNFLISNNLSKFKNAVPEAIQKVVKKFGFHNGYSWMAGFVARGGVRDWHVDWYNGFLLMLKGKKTVLIQEEMTKESPPFLYSYSADINNIYKPKAYKKLIIREGEALKIPSFVPHKIINSDNTENIAISASFDDTVTLSLEVPELYSELSSGRWAENISATLNLCNYRVNKKMRYMLHSARKDQFKDQIIDCIKEDIARNEASK